MTDTKCLSESDIVRAIASEACRRCTRKIIADLQSMSDDLQSDEGSGLANTWDELCVQFQDEQSFYWEAYDRTIWALVGDYIKKLKPHEREAIWLQTPEAFDWKCEDEDARAAWPVCDSDIVKYLLNSWVYEAAGNWTNARIRAYLNDRH